MDAVPDGHTGAWKGMPRSLSLKSEGMLPQKSPNTCMIFFIYISKIILVWHALTVTLVVFGIFCYSENIFDRA